MTSEPEQPSIQVEIAGDGMSATLIFPRELGEQELTPESLFALIENSGVEVTPDVKTRVESIVAEYLEEPSDVSAVVAQGSEPVKGQDGGFEWVEGFDPSQPAEPSEPESSDNASEAEDTAIDFYNAVTYLTVKADTHIATLHPPTEGEAGADVLGQPIPTSPGEPAALQIDESLKLEADGRIISQVDGILLLDGEMIKVSRQLDIKGNVDFSTGNLSFDGDIHVHDSVRDKFVVRATGNVVIDGLVEAATLLAGGNLTCQCGMAGRYLGQFIVDGDMEIGYLDDASGRVQGNLTFRREVLNCQVAVGGDLIGPKGALLGGTASVTGAVHLDTLGSDAAAPTTVVLGSVPLITGQLRQLSRLAQQIEHVLARGKPMPVCTGDDKEVCIPAPALPVGLDCSRSELRLKLRACGQKRDELIEQIEQIRRVQLTVDSMIYQKVLLRIGEHDLLFEQRVRGPLVITWDQDLRPTISEAGGDPHPLTDVTKAINLAA